jgi:hypothetical protein
MKTIAMLLLGILLAATTGCDGQDNGTLAFTGTVSHKSLESGFFAIDADNGQGYEPINLPADFAIDGLRVRVSARVRDDMASINMYGSLIEIVAISRL